MSHTEQAGFSELKPEQQLSLPRIAAQSRVVIERRPVSERLRVDVPEARRGHSKQCRPICESVGGNRVCHIRAIEGVEEFKPKLQRHLLPYFEQTAEAELFQRMTLIPVVVVVSGCRPESSGRRIQPGRRVQYEILVRIDAVAVQILEEQRLPGDAVHERARG